MTRHPLGGAAAAAANSPFALPVVWNGSNVRKFDTKRGFLKYLPSVKLLDTLTEHQELSDNRDSYTHRAAAATNKD